MKKVCYNGNGGSRYTEQKCLYSEEYFSWDTEKDTWGDYFLFKGAVCSNDPHYYQLCDREIGGKITNNQLLCEYFLCDVLYSDSSLKKKRLLVSNELGRLHGEIICKNTELNKAELKDDTVLLSKRKVHSSQICDGKCDVIFCEDEGYCNGYSYGFNCRAEWNINMYRFIPPQELCDGNAVCFEKEDEENCTVTSDTEPSCRHVVTGKQVPVHNYTRCSRIDMSLYASNVFSYCEASDMVLYQTNCSDPNHVGVTCKIHGYKSTVSKVLICSHENLDVCDDKIERECLKTKNCKVHKHKMCDRIIDCIDETDEKDTSCISKTKATCKRRVGTKENLPIPISWLKDGVRDCEDGVDETGNWPTCGVEGSNLRYVSSNEMECRNVFICRTGDPGYEELENLCDGLESCGNENEICSVSNRPQSLAISVPTTNKGLTKSLSYCLRGFRNLKQLLKRSCDTEEFLFPDENIFGASRTSVILPHAKQLCDYMYGEQYLYTSCTGRCIRASCPFKTIPRYEVCPSQFPNRIGTIVNNEYLVFVTKSYGNVFTNRYFVCDDEIKCIDYSKVCDLVYDCNDSSDEVRCINHFKCNSSTKLIPKTKKCDGHIDCFDLSDECNEQCSKEILDGYWLKGLSWLIGLLAIVANLTIIGKCLWTLKRCRTLPALINRSLIAIIALGDLLIGCYLFIIASYDRMVFQKSYCRQQLTWITQLECSVIGVVSTIGSQISLFSMTGLSIVRMHGIWKSMNIPVEVTKLKFLWIILMMTILILNSAVIAVIPLMSSFEDLFVNGIKFSDKIRIFIGPSSKATLLEVIEAYYGRTKVTSPNWKMLIQMVKDMFSHDLNYEDPTIKVDKINFYGNDGVCLFKYFVQNDDPQKLFVWSILALNFVCFSIISASYLVIGILSHRSSQSLSCQQIQKRNNKMNQRIAMIITIDFLCWVPFIVICMLHSLEVIDATPWYSIFSMIILPINSVINPFLYDDTLTKGMRTLSQALAACVKCNPNVASQERKLIRESTAEATRGITREAMIEVTRKTPIEEARGATKGVIIEGEIIEAAREAIIEATASIIGEAARGETIEAIDGEAKEVRTSIQLEETLV